MEPESGPSREPRPSCSPSPGQGPPPGAAPLCSAPLGCRPCRCSGTCEPQLVGRGAPSRAAGAESLRCSGPGRGPHLASQAPAASPPAAPASEGQHPAIDSLVRCPPATAPRPGLTERQSGTLGWGQGIHALRAGRAPCGRCRRAGDRLRGGTSSARRSGLSPLSRDPSDGAERAGGPGPERPSAVRGSRGRASPGARVTPPSPSLHCPVTSLSLRHHHPVTAASATPLSAPQWPGLSELGCLPASLGLVHCRGPCWRGPPHPGPARGGGSQAWRPGPGVRAELGWREPRGVPHLVHLFPLGRGCAGWAVGAGHCRGKL